MIKLSWVQTDHTRAILQLSIENLKHNSQVDAVPFK